jgi:hypothetical protein
MAQIDPIVFPLVGTATKLEVTVLGFPTNALTCRTQFMLKTEDDVQCYYGDYELTEEQFAAWGQDNSVVDGYVANYLGVVIVPPII